VSRRGPLSLNRQGSIWSLDMPCGILKCEQLAVFMFLQTHIGVLVDRRACITVQVGVLVQMSSISAHV
jgi:hypothetical protein